MSPYAAPPMRWLDTVPGPSSLRASHSTWPRFIRYGGILSPRRPGGVFPSSGKITHIASLPYQFKVLATSRASGEVEPLTKNSKASLGGVIRAIVGRHSPTLAAGVDGDRPTEVQLRTPIVASIPRVESALFMCSLTAGQRAWFRCRPAQLRNCGPVRLVGCSDEGRNLLDRRYSRSGSGGRLLSQSDRSGHCRKR